MPRKRYKPEEIVAKLRQVDVLVSQGQAWRSHSPDRRECQAIVCLLILTCCPRGQSGKKAPAMFAGAKEQRC
jgi:hypothetical protein